MRGSEVLHESDNTIIYFHPKVCHRQRSPKTIKTTRVSSRLSKYNENSYNNESTYQHKSLSSILNTSSTFVSAMQFMLNAFFTSTYTSIAECNTRQCSLMLALSSAGIHCPSYSDEDALPISYIWGSHPTRGLFHSNMNA